MKVVEIPGTPGPAVFQPLSGVAVVAKDTWAAIKAPQGAEDRMGRRRARQLRLRMRTARELEAGGAQAAARCCARAGDVDAALAKAARKVEAEYYLPHIAHATMEPPNATARIVNGHCEVWAPTQAPQATREDVAKRLGMPLDKVTVHVTLLGGGFGRKSKPDFAIEAALLSKEMDGKPVKVTWTREDDLHHDYFHTVSVERLQAGLDAQGKATAWLHRSVGAHASSRLSRRIRSTRRRSSWAWGSINVPFEIPNMRIENPEAAAHTRIGWFRSVSNIPHAFAVQSFVAELAAAAGRDHRDYLLELIGPRAAHRSGQHQRRLEPWRIAAALSGRHRPAAPRDRDASRARPAGAASCPKGRASAWPRTTAS